MSPKCLKLFTLLLLAPGVAGYSLRRGQSTGMSSYDPVDILCERGRNEEGKIIAPWCKQFLGCIKDKATPAESPDAVLKAWAPASCREVCDIWLTSSASLMQNTTHVPGFEFLDIQRSTHDATDCKKSCTNFQKSLSTCVATIMFEPGKVAAMGAPKGQKAAPAICKKKKSPCVPDLPVRYQECAAHRTKKVLDPSYEVSKEVSMACKLAALNMEDCAGCPQLAAGAQSHYAAFTGGCMDQLHSYWVASNYGAAGQHAALPAGTGCRVHTKVELKAGAVRKAKEVAKAQEDLAAEVAAEKAKADEKAARQQAQASVAKKNAGESAKQLAAKQKAAEEAKAQQKAAEEAAAQAKEALAKTKAEELAKAKAAKQAAQEVAKAAAKKAAEEAAGHKKRAAEAGKKLAAKKAAAKEAAAKQKAAEEAAAKAREAAAKAAAKAKKVAEAAALAKKRAEQEAAVKKAADEKAAKEKAQAEAAKKKAAEAAAAAAAAAAKICQSQLKGKPCGVQWAFVTDSRNNLVAIKKGPKTGSGKTEVHRLTAASNYKTFDLQTRTALQLTDKNWDFVMDSKDNLVAILKGPTSGSKKTEVHRLSASSNYLAFDMQTRTGLHYTDENWAFTMDSKDNLVCVLKGPSGSKKTEVHRLSASSNYINFDLQTATGLHYTNAAANKGDWDFKMDPQDNLVCILKGPTSGSGKTEVHKLTQASNFKTFSLHTSTALPYSNTDWAFAMRGNDVVSILKGRTSGSCMTEVHLLNGAANYGNYVFQTGTGLGLSAATSCPVR